MAWVCTFYKDEIMEGLINVMFAYNNYTKKYTAFHRDDFIAYWSGGVYKYKPLIHKDFRVLHDMVAKNGLEKK